MGKPSITDVRGLKAAGLNTFCAVTAVNYWQAVCASEAGAAVLNVNDVAVSRLLLGRPAGFDYSTTVEEMIMATKAVKQGSGDCLVIPSLPFGYYNTPEDALTAATRIFKETGCDAIHMEGAPVECVQAVCDAGWPVLGHAGINKFYLSATRTVKSLGRTLKSAQEIYDYAVALEEVGAFCVVLEGIPTALAKKITEKLGVCTCGIGAGKYCNGQFLVTDDLLGFMPDFTPKFVKKYADARSFLVGGIKAFVDDVAAGNFPDDAHSYGVSDESYIALVK
ncbi:MAG: 3-methyl-2-oxobutanoate hydroxymethyltransferase [Coriobacteriales bacterium]|jgi:3-methyl-2-oxobutanoate hydroxymethyltransferase|nr:3-methyl-2-oxobutanoate hydroxymethyltransferase [Coriobacteriales bacterium]